MRFMKHIQLLAAGMALASVATGTQARELDPLKGEDAIKINRKIHCSTKDGEPIFYQWVGKVYSRVQGERDRHLFNVQGMNVRQCVTVEDEERGEGYRMVSREIMLYLDPNTNEILDSWENPWTGEDVDVIHVDNDPVNMRSPTFPKRADGSDFTVDMRVKNGKAFMFAEVPLFYTNALGGDFQTYVGNHYHAMEIFDFIADSKELLDSRKKTAYPSVAWVRIAQWLPWMEMGSRPGLMVANAGGQKVKGFDDLTPLLQSAIKTRYPKYDTPPPADDARPNETSWTFFRKVLSEKMKNEKKAGGAGGH